MNRFCLLALAGLIFVDRPAVKADAFDRYINPVLAKAPGHQNVKQVKQLTADLLLDHEGVLPNTTAALIVVKTNDNRWAKMLVTSARQKIGDKESVPILLIERFATYKEGEERTVVAQGKNVQLYHGFHFNLDIGQVVPPDLGGDLRFVARDKNLFAEPLGKAHVFIVTKPLPEAAPKKGEKVVIGETFEPRYFNGTYQLFDDGRRSGKLVLKLENNNEISGDYYSDKDGKKYEVKGKIGAQPHSIQFAIKFPQTEQAFQGLLFTGDGKAMTGSSKLQERETGFYAVRVDEEN